MSGPLLIVTGLTKSYGKKEPANDGVSVDVRPGEVCGLLGPNGAGKTTLVNQIIGLLRPGSGTIHLDGADLVRRPDLARRLCSYLPQGPLPIDGLPARSAIELIGRIRGGAAREVRERAAALLRDLEIEEWAGQVGERLSGGVRRLVGYAMAAVSPGRIVILDEPTNDVDPLRRRLLWRDIRRLAADGAGILLVTHNVLEAERSVDRLAIMDRGRILTTGTPAELTRERGPRLRLELTLEPEVPAPDPPGWADTPARSGRRLLLRLEEDRAGEALEWARGLRRDGTAESFELGPTTLEDTYLRWIGREDVAS